MRGLTGFVHAGVLRLAPSVAAFFATKVRGASVTAVRLDLLVLRYADAHRIHARSRYCFRVSFLCCTYGTDCWSVLFVPGTTLITSARLSVAMALPCTQCQATWFDAPGPLVEKVPLAVGRLRADVLVPTFLLLHDQSPVRT